MALKPVIAGFVNVPDGGGTNSNLGTTVAWLASTGNDSTGQVGQIAFPFATLQAAYNAGARSFLLGPRSSGGYGDLTANISGQLFLEFNDLGVRWHNLIGGAVPSNINISTTSLQAILLYGAGPNFVLGNVTFDCRSNSGTNSIYTENFTATTISYKPGASLGVLYLNNVQASTVNTVGVEGHDGSGTTNASSGGSAADLYANYCIVGNANLYGQNGGVGVPVTYEITIIPGTPDGDYSGTITYQDNSGTTHNDVLSFTLDGGGITNLAYSDPTALSRLDTPESNVIDVNYIATVTNIQNYTQPPSTDIPGTWVLTQGSADGNGGNGGNLYGSYNSITNTLNTGGQGAVGGNSGNVSTHFCNLDSVIDNAPSTGANYANGNFYQ